MYYLNAFGVFLLLIMKLKVNASTPGGLVLSQSYNQFSFKLYNQISKSLKDKNIFFSPYSVSSSLTMCTIGARNETEKQLRELLNYTELTNEFINQQSLNIIDYLNTFKGDVTLNIANRLYPKQGFPIRLSYAVALHSYYRSHINPIDFTNHTIAANLINEWISAQTGNKITDLIKPDLIDDDIALILVNAIYFKGNWFYRFNKDETKNDTFYLENGQNKTVEMMHLSNGFFQFKRNPANLNALVCELPYVGRNISMTIILPNENVTLNEIENQLDLNTIKTIFETQTRRTKVDVYIPKFKFDQAIELNKILISMGASDAFDKKKANFNGISPNLYISKVLHKAVVDVSEEGTEAAAATAVLTNNRNSVIDFQFETTPIFKCNKPFLFIIHETQNNIILFMGRYVN